MNVTARHLYTPDPAEVLTAEIHAIAAQIDTRIGKPPGTALRGIYFWHWPPGSQSADVLTQLHADAVTMLAALVTATAGGES